MAASWERGEKRPSKLAMNTFLTMLVLLPALLGGLVALNLQAGDFGFDTLCTLFVGVSNIFIMWMLVLRSAGLTKRIADESSVGRPRGF